MPPKRRCIAKTKQGVLCRKFTKSNSKCCSVHQSICANSKAPTKKSKPKATSKSKTKDKGMLHTDNNAKKEKKTTEEKKEKNTTIAKTEEKKEEDETKVVIQKLDPETLKLLRTKFKGGVGILTPETEPKTATEFLYQNDPMPDQLAQDLYGIRRSCVSEWKTKWEKRKGNGLEGTVYESCKGHDCSYAVKVFFDVVGDRIDVHLKEVAIGRLMGEQGLGPRVYDAFLCKNKFFIVMEQIVGVSYSRARPDPD
jgi:hypothetical protein